MEVKDGYLLLRIFVDSTDKFRYTPLYEVVVHRAKKFGLAGATVIEGFQGFGAGSVLHDHNFWEIEDKEPVTIEIIDEEEKIMSFYESLCPFLEKLPFGCFITSEKTDVLFYRKRQKTGHHHTQ